MIPAALGTEIHFKAEDGPRRTLSVVGYVMGLIGEEAEPLVVESGSSEVRPMPLYEWKSRNVTKHTTYGVEIHSPRREP